VNDSFVFNMFCNRGDVQQVSRYGCGHGLPDESHGTMPLRGFAK